MKRTLLKQIELWVIANFHRKYVSRVTQDLIDVATGNRKGNPFEIKAIKKACDI